MNPVARSDLMVRDLDPGLARSVIGNLLNALAERAVHHCAVLQHQATPPVRAIRSLEQFKDIRVVIGCAELHQPQRSGGHVGDVLCPRPAQQRSLRGDNEVLQLLAALLVGVQVRPPAKDRRHFTEAPACLC